MSISKGTKPRTLDGRVVQIHDGYWISDHCVSLGNYQKGNLTYRLNKVYGYQEPGQDLPNPFFVYLEQKDMGIIGKFVRLELVQVLGKTPIYRCRIPTLSEDIVYDCRITEDFVDTIVNYEDEYLLGMPWAQ